MLDVLPTKERQTKPDYEPEYNVKGKPNGKRRRGDALKMLERSGEIPGEAVTAANRWYADFVFWQDGIIELPDLLPENYLRGDIHTFNTARGKAAERISLVRETMGDNAHRWLVFLLIHGFSFSSLGAELYPEHRVASQNQKVSQQAAMLLNILPSAYASARKKQNDDRQKAREILEYRQRLGLSVYVE